MGAGQADDSWHRRQRRLGICRRFPRGEDLAGGVFGVALGGLCAAESMFTRRRDGSKVALATLVGRLRRCGVTLVDIQILTPHMARLRAVEISRAEYLRRLRAALSLEVSFDEGGPA